MDQATTAPAKRASSQYLPEVPRFLGARHRRAGTPHVIRRGAAVQHRVTIEEAIPELRDLRELLEENLAALRTLYVEQRQALAKHAEQPGAPIEELRALAAPGAPWVTALDETRRLIRSSFVEIAASYVRSRALRDAA